MNKKEVFPFELGHALFLGEFRYLVRDLSEEHVYLASITDVSGKSGKWIPKNRVPIPYAQVKNEKLKHFVGTFGKPPIRQ